jgi:transketolase
LDAAERSVLADAARASRGFILDMVAATGTGHLGMALGCGEIGAVLFGKFLRCDGTAPGWVDRDRFVLSAGHGSAFLYTWLHLSGYAINLEDLRNFRSGSTAAKSHPEFYRSLGVECTTGPLGQGVANAVGMALSQQLFAGKLGADARQMHCRTVCLAGDGCLQEGVALEAIALAGLWELGNLILVYDDNGITLDGPSSATNVGRMDALFRSCNWKVQRVDGHDLDELAEALLRARALPGGQPQVIIAKTVAGKGVAAIEGSPAAHGNGLRTEELRRVREELGLGPEPFAVPNAVAEYFSLLSRRRRWERERWQENFAEVLERHPDAMELLFPKPFDGERWAASLGPLGGEKRPTRFFGGTLLRELAKKLPQLVSIGADLFSSTGTAIGDGSYYAAENTEGRNVQCGAREHAMGAIANGLAYDGMFRPIVSTFLVFSDYLRPAIRLGAMAKLPILYVFTHDSIAVGEDGPTHHPVEMLPSLRAIPHLNILRPADGEETAGALAAALDGKEGPAAVILTRQGVPSLDSIPVQRRRNGVHRGAYVAKLETEPLELILLASGSELHRALASAEGIPSCRVVSVPCLEAFNRQPQAYRDEVLPPHCRKRLAIEAAGPMSWWCHVEPENVISVDDFGECLSGELLLEQRGFSVATIRERMRELSGRSL